MSAFVVSEETYTRLFSALVDRVVLHGDSLHGRELGERLADVLVEYADRANVTPIPRGKPLDRILNTISAFVNDLQAKNVESVAFRYREEPSDVRRIVYRKTLPVPLEQIIKWLECIDYQSCELAHWEDTQVCKASQELVSILSGAIVKRSASYDSASWG
jgi:hypothetical protein